MSGANRKIDEFFKLKPGQASLGEALGGPTNQLVIKSSDDEESDSDTPLEDLSSLLQLKSSKSTSHEESNCPQAWKNTRSRIGKKQPASPVAAKHKYQFDLKKLVIQAEIADATEESAKRVKALLDDSPVTASTPSSFKPLSTHNEVLSSLTADEEGVNVERLLQAVRRTEATQSEKRWYFFNLYEENKISTFPASNVVDGWKAGIADPWLREQTILSGFAKDMITLEDFLPDEYFLWILDEMCIEKRADLREAYCSTLVASKEQIRRLIQPGTIANFFCKLGARKTSVELFHKISLVTQDSPDYESQDWAVLRTVITFIGNISRYLSEPVRSYALSILVRLCADSVVIGNIGLLAAIQKAIEKISKNISGMFWTNSSRELCNSIFFSIEEAALRFQIIRCIPRTTVRLHELRRRLALSSFFSDIGYASRPSYDHLDLWEITKRLNEQKFKISRDTDHHELAALISILDIAIDNGQSTGGNLNDTVLESEFNTDVDELADRIKVIWSSISDGGASFMSRIDAKEVMEGLRNRLIYGVRTKLKPKQSIFDSVPDDIEGVRKQSAMMSKYFKRDLSGS